MALNCAKCNKEIETGNLITALCKKWHMECFTCEECKQMIKGGNFSSADNHPYCIPCFAKEFLKCAKCQKNLDHEKTCVKALGGIYHDECFTCHKCNAPMGTKTFSTKNQQPFCDKCFKTTCEEENGLCAGCKKVIDAGVVVNALEKKWHKSCFKCSNCSLDMSNKAFHVHDDKPYCTKCSTTNFASKCKKCRRLIEPGVQFVKLENATYHHDCFVCMKCRKSLAGKKFIAKKDHHYCVEHA